MDTQALSRGIPYGVAYEGTTSVDGLMKLIQALVPFEVDDLLVLPYRVGESASPLKERMDTLAIQGFGGLVAVCVLGVHGTDDALYACLSLRDALASPDLMVVAVVSSERKAELAKALAIGGFADLPKTQAGVSRQSAREGRLKPCA